MRTPWHLAAVAAVLAAPVTAQPAAIAGPAAQAPKPADSVQNCPDCPALAIIPAQSVRIGAGDDELDRRATERAHTAATIARPFAMATTEVTRPQYAAFVAQSGYKPPVGTQPECWREDLAGAPVKGRSIGTTEGRRLRLQDTDGRRLDFRAGLGTYRHTVEGPCRLSQLHARLPRRR